MIDVALNCTGSGVSPRYETDDGDSFRQKDAGDPWRHADGCLGLSGMTAPFDARLAVGVFDITGGAVEMRVPSSVRGVRSGFGNPNGEYPPVAGTAIRFKHAGFRIGRPARLISDGVDDRMSLPTIENLCLYRDPAVRVSKELGDGAAFWTDSPSDQLTIHNVNVACCTYGLLNTSYLDAIRIRALHTGRVTFPLYFAPAEEAGSLSACWFGTVSDCCFADGDGPVVIAGESHPWNFSNVFIVRQGRRPTHHPSCNIVWSVSHGRYQGGAIDSPGQTWPISDGRVARAGGQIDADGMVLSGNGNAISTFFRNASGKGRANLRLIRGSSGNMIQSQFAGTLNGAVDLILEEDCADNVVHVVPGMTIIDFGRNNHYIGAEWAGRLEFKV